jgi:hypothetical protein
MIDLSNVGNALEYFIRPKVERQLGFTYLESKKRLLDNIKEYLQLNNRQWKKKRQLKKIMVSEILVLNDFLNNLDVPDLTPSEYERSKK